MPLFITDFLDICDPVLAFDKIMEEIEIKKYLRPEPAFKPGRPGYNRVNMLKTVLFGFMDTGYASLRELEDRCKTNIRYMYLMDYETPSYRAFSYFINKEISESVQDIFKAIMTYIEQTDGIDLQHTYIDGTKIEANANRYTWVWKKTCIKNRQKVFDKISCLIDAMNQEVLGYLGIKFEKRQEYAIEYVSELLTAYKGAAGLDEASFVSGCGHRKSIQQKQYQELQGYLLRLKNYAHHIEICGDERNSYSKTDPDATFMRLKRDYMGNDQLLPAYNLQAAICDEYIAVIDVKPYASDMECFVPLMEKFYHTYGYYPKYPVADAGYGSYNNYLYCEEHGMEKYMKFTMYKKETADKKYRENPYRAVNFVKDEDGNLRCPNGRKFLFRQTQHVKYNKYGRTEELYECESCEGCPHKQECCPKAHKNRTIRLNQELTAIHQEVLKNLESIHGALLRMNRSIQSEGTFGVLKWDKSYKRLFRRGEKNVLLELTMISCGFNLYKYHNKKQRQAKAA